jgi:hypothetical protein
LGVPLFGGCGLFLDLGNPAAVSDPVARGAFVTVRLYNCLGASDEGAGIGYPREGAVVSGTAEGIVNGERLSMPLRIVKLAGSGLSAVFWRQPQEGVWILNFRITNAGAYFIGGESPAVLGALVNVRPGGVERQVRPVRTPLSQDEIDRALQNLTAACEAAAARGAAHSGMLRSQPC